MKQPRFWNSINALSVALLPFSFVYNIASKVNLLVQSFFAYRLRSGAKIICVGNVNVGGGGKTQVVLQLTDMLLQKGLCVCVVMQGYKGSLSNAKTATVVNVKKHTAFDVGDEPFMVASKCVGNGVNVVVNHNKKLAVMCAEKFNPDVIIMDDGMQNMSVKKDATICVVDGKSRFGNGFVMPAGPLRESIASGMRKSDAVIIIRHDEKNIRHMLKKMGQKNIFNGEIIPDFDDEILFKNGKKVFAFCAIAKPEKFFDSLQKLEVKIDGRLVFADHHMYTESDIKNIVGKYSKEYVIITTDKDYVKIPDKYKKFIVPFSVKLKLCEESKFEKFISSIVNSGG